MCWLHAFTGPGIFTRRDRCWDENRLTWVTGLIGAWLVTTVTGRLSFQRTRSKSFVLHETYSPREIFANDFLSGRGALPMNLSWTVPKGHIPISGAFNEGECSEIIVKVNIEAWTNICFLQQSDDNVAGVSNSIIRQFCVISTIRLTVNDIAIGRCKIPNLECWSNWLPLNSLLVLIAPEIFNHCLIYSVIFLWCYEFCALVENIEKWPNFVKRVVINEKRNCDVIVITKRLINYK